MLESLPRTRLETLMPRLLQTCASCENNQQTFLRVLGLVQVILRRSAYLALLVENAQALKQLCILCERSSWIADELAAYPALLDELLDPRTLYTAPEKQLLRDQLRQQTLRIASDDLEQQMEVIRYFCRSYTLRVAACEVTDMRPDTSVGPIAPHLDCRGSGRACGECCLGPARRHLWAARARRLRFSQK